MISDISQHRERQSAPPLTSFADEGDFNLAPLDESPHHSSQASSSSNSRVSPFQADFNLPSSHRRDKFEARPLASSSSQTHASFASSPHQSRASVELDRVDNLLRGLSDDDFVDNIDGLDEDHGAHPQAHPSPSPHQPPSIHQNRINPDQHLNLSHLSLLRTIAVKQRKMCLG